MKKKITAFIAGGAAAVAAAGAMIPAIMTTSAYEEITEENKAALLGIDGAPEDYFLGVASQFSMFVEGDFAAKGSDCEGRLAAGGNANIGTVESYDVGAKSIENGAADVAHVVIGGDTLTQFNVDVNKKFVVPKGADVQLSGANVYEGKLFDFGQAFSFLEKQSTYASTLDTNAEVEMVGKKIVINCSDEKMNILNLDEFADAYETFTKSGEAVEIEFNMPKGSYLIVNIKGTEINMPQTSAKVKYTGTDEEIIKEGMPVLYNLYEAESFAYTGAIHGSTLAPKADATGDIYGHVYGQTIAKSFSGVIQFGTTTFDVENFNKETPVESSTTAATTTENVTTETTAAETTAVTTKKPGAVLPGDETKETTAATTENSAETTTENAVVGAPEGTTTVSADNSATAVTTEAKTFDDPTVTGEVTGSNNVSSNGETTAAESVGAVTNVSTEAVSSEDGKSTDKSDDKSTDKKSTDKKDDKSTKTTSAKTTAAAKASDSPKTGDAGTGIAVTVVLGAAVGLAFTLRKRNENA